MFTVFDVGGALFRGSLEELQRVSRTLGLTRARRIDARLDHIDHPLGANPPGPHAPTTLGQQARHEYASLQAPQPAARQPLRRVAEVMNHRVVSVQATATVQEAWQALLDAQVGQAPVVNAQGRLIGLLTRAELLNLDRLPRPAQASLVWRALLVQPVTEVMVSPVTGVAPETDIRRLAHLLLSTGLPGLPVLDAADAMVGFVSRSDILLALVHDPPLDMWS